MTKNSNSNSGRLTHLAAPWKCRNCGSKVWRISVSGCERFLDSHLLDETAEVLFRGNNLELGTYWIRPWAGSWFADYRRRLDVLSGQNGKLVLADHVHTALATAELPTYFKPKFTYEIPERPAF